MPVYTQAILNTSVSSIVSGTFTAANFLTVANRAARQVVADVDIRSMKRRSALSPNLMDDVFGYTCPGDLKGLKLIDIQPQIDRGRFDDWRLTTEEEFDRIKEHLGIDRFGDPVSFKRNSWVGDAVVAISDKGMVKKVLISRPVDDTETVIDSLDAVGDWVLFGDGTNLTADSENFVKGSACINWDISAAGGTTAGISNSSVDSLDISDYLSAGYALVWAYVTSATNLTNLIFRIGSSSSAYNYITVTTNNEGNAFRAGWNLLRFGFANKSTTGSPTNTTCTYVALYMTKAGAKVSETDYRFDNLVLKIGNHYDLIYYSDYAWQSSTGTYLENATATTDLLNADTDEIGLFELKTASFIEKHLKNYKRAAELEKDYQAAKAKYEADNPSEALNLTTTYHNF